VTNSHTLWIRKRGWDGTIRLEVWNQSTSSHTLWTRRKRTGWDDQTRGLQSINKFTYFLRMDKEDGMG
jgi:hypothetical protein